MVKTLQHHINNLQKWSDDWFLQFNETKCKIIHSGHNNIVQDYFINNTQLITEKEKDLGVIITNNMKPSSQCADAANKALIALRKARRSIKLYLTIDSFKILQRHMSDLIWSFASKPGALTWSKIYKF